MKFSKLVASAALGGFLSTIPLLTNAFTLSGNDGGAQGWADPEVKFLVNTSNCPAGVDIVALVQESIKVWNQVPTSRIKLSYGGSTTSTTDSNPPTIYCTSDMTPFAGAGSNDGTAGVGRGNRQVLGGPIVTGLLIINASGGQSSVENQPDVARKVVMAHEMGHVLGIGHSQDAGALMWSDASAKTSFTLAQDDIDAITYLYPRNELGQDQLMGCGLAKNASSPPPGSAAGLMLLLSLPVIFAFWLRRHRTAAAL